jgi:hypothetical protein
VQPLGIEATDVPKAMVTSLALARVWARVVGAAAARRAIPVWAGLGVVAAIVFGGTGMHAGDVTMMARGEPVVGAGLMLLWLILVAPVGAAMIEPRATAWLRALPGRRAVRGAVTAAIAIAVQGPWILLWGLGVGPLAGAGAGVLAAVLMIVVARVRWPFAARSPRWRGPVRALVGVHVRALVRTRGPAIARGLAWAGCGGATAGLIVRGNQLDAAGALAAILLAVAIAAPMGLAGLAAPVAESDRAIAWAIVAVPAGARAAAQAIVLAIVGAALAAALVGAASLVGAAPLAAIAAAPALGAGLGAASARLGAWATAGAVTDGTRVVIGMTAAAVMTTAAIGALGAWAIAVVAAGGAGMVATMASPRSRSRA